jgi:hypothetical protein
MHPEAYSFIERAVKGLEVNHQPTVLEFGSRDVNGSPRTIFGAPVHYHGVDIEGGPGVDQVADASDPELDARHRCYDPGLYDVVICAEVAEHTPSWRGIIANAYKHLDKGGLFIFTAACDPRPAHSAVDGRNLERGEYTQDETDTAYVEYYANIDPNELGGALANAGFHDIKVTVLGRGDVQATAVK